MTAEVLATKVKVIKLGILGRLHIKGENKHHMTTKRYIFECEIFNGLARTACSDLMTLTVSVIK